MLMPFIAMGFYAYFFDNTRVGHPDYKKSSSYKGCLRVANNIYNERMDKALADPSVWMLSGYNSARDFANAGKRLAISNCG